MASSLFGINSTISNLFGNPQPQTTPYQPLQTIGYNYQSLPATKGIGPVSPTNGGGNISSSNVPTQQVDPNTQQTFDPYAQLRGEIGAGWDNYLGSLNDMFGGLSGQQTAQNNIINSQYDQGVNGINASKAKSLKDIAGNITSAFQAGNNYLGARGAGDSSAANQYSYALSREAGKQTSNLNEFVNTQLDNLRSTKDQQTNQVALWFNEQQNAIRQMIAQGQLNKAQDIQNLSRDILNRGLAAVDQINQGAQNKYNALVQWAANNATSLQGLQKDIASIPQPVGMPTVDSSGNFRVPVGYGNGNNDNQQPLFRNPAWFQ